MKTGYDQFFKNAKQTAVTQTRADHIKNLKKNKSAKPKKKFPIGQFFIFSILGFGGFLAFENSDQIEVQLKKIDITMSVAHAEEKVQPAVVASAAQAAPAAVEASKEKKNVDDADYLFKLTRTKISSVLEEKIKADDVKVETLVQMYSNMKPPQVAKVFETLDEDLVIEILSRMKKKVAGDILNLVKPEKAQIFAERFAGYRSPANQ